MDDADQAILRKVQDAFKNETRPAQMVRNPNHCAECGAANAFLLQLGPSDISHTTIGDRIGFDYFSMTTPEAFRYFFPTLCRMALDEQSSHDILLRLKSNAAFFSDDHQRQTVCEFLDYLLGRFDYDRDVHAEVVKLQGKIRMAEQ